MHLNEMFALLHKQYTITGTEVKMAFFDCYKHIVINFIFYFPFYKEYYYIMF